MSSESSNVSRVSIAMVPERLSGRFLWGGYRKTPRVPIDRSSYSEPTYRPTYGGYGIRSVLRNPALEQRRCFKCKMPGHMGRDCPFRGQVNLRKSATRIQRNRERMSEYNAQKGIINELPFSSISNDQLCLFFVNNDKDKIDMLCRELRGVKAENEQLSSINSKLVSQMVELNTEIESMNNFRSKCTSKFTEMGKAYRRQQEHLDDTLKEFKQARITFNEHIDLKEKLVKEMEYQVDLYRNELLKYKDAHTQCNVTVRNSSHASHPNVASHSSNKYRSEESFMTQAEESDDHLINIEGHPSEQGETENPTHAIKTTHCVRDTPYHHRSRKKKKAQAKK